MKIHIMGASGSGVTTLGKALSTKLNFPYFDSDDYFWENSEIPFTVKRDPEQRNHLLDTDLEKQTDYIIGGSLLKWSEKWIFAFDLVVFLWIPTHLRTERLRKRELERYGDIILADPERNRLFEEFIHWASGYDNNTDGGRSLYTHQEWLKKLKCKVLEIKGDVSVEERIEKIAEVLK